MADTGAAACWAAAALFAWLRLSAVVPGACGRTLAGPATNYYSTLKVVTDIVAQDVYWARAFEEPVWYRPDREHFGRVVDGELLEGALVSDPPGGLRADGPEPPADPAASRNEHGEDAIRPMRFVRNVMHRRYRIGSVLAMAADVLQMSLTCVSYKHAVHLLKLIRVEIGRSGSERKAISWSDKAIGAMAKIVMKMAGLHYTDALLLQAAAFLDSYRGNGATGARRDKFDLTPEMDRLSREMLEYVGRHCVRAPKDEREVAKELRVLITEKLYSPVGSKQIHANVYKNMVKSSMQMIDQLYDALPGTVGMSSDRWNELLHFKRKADDENQLMEFIRLSP